MILKDKVNYPLTCIVAMTKDRVIGDGKKLLWHLPNDLKRLKSLTMGFPLIMGRKTWDSIGRPLPGRGSIVLTTSGDWEAYGAIKSLTFDEAIIRSNEWIKENISKKDIKPKIFLFGGAEIYKLGIDYCDTIEMTIVDLPISEGLKFPILEEDSWEKILKEEHNKTELFPSYSHWFYKRIKKVNL